MTWNTINRAITISLDYKDNLNFKQIIYEGYKLGGLAIIVDCFTDNLHCTVSKIRYVLVKKRGKLSMVVYLTY
ncbi:YebC/PmpR family DNA-binding transcriptional regulator [Pantoea sp. Aalb]|uniref:YebC/PmpR family DNA-binding transcriptional regulator n=1 Tax=Pantoea sp. Aalb TaxID=2576762 RepID=UPI00351AE208